MSALETNSAAFCSSCILFIALGVTVLGCASTGARPPQDGRGSSATTSGVGPGSGEGTSMRQPSGTGQPSRAALVVDAASRGGHIASGVVVSTSQQLVYIMAPTGVSAIEAHSGKQIWHQPAATKPMLIVGDRLIALGGNGAMVLDTRSGREAASCPDGPKVVVQIQNRLGTSYSSRAWISDGKPVIAWSVATRYAGGMAPTPEMAAAAQSHTGGAFTVDVATGCVTVLEAPPTPSWPHIAFAPNGELAAFSVRNMEVSVTSSPASPRPALTLHRRRSQQPLADIPLSTGADGYGMPALSADYRHVVAIRQQVSSAGLKYDWRLITLDAGTTVEMTQQGGGRFGFVVLGDVIITANHFVQAVSMAGGSLWTRQLRSTNYRGPYPP